MADMGSADVAVSGSPEKSRCRAFSVNPFGDLACHPTLTWNCRLICACASNSSVWAEWVRGDRSVVRCKLNLQSGGDWSCASVSRPCVEQIAPGHYGYPRASDLILG